MIHTVCMENKITDIFSIDDMMGHFMLIGFTPIIWSLTAGCIIDQVSRICKSELAGLTVLCFLSSGNRCDWKTKEFDDFTALSKFHHSA